MVDASTMHLCALWSSVPAGGLRGTTGGAKVLHRGGANATRHPYSSAGGPPEGLQLRGEGANTGGANTGGAFILGPVRFSLPQLQGSNS